MLKPLATLIKINKAELDERRKNLVILLDSKQQRIDEIKRLEDSIKSEGEKLSELQEEFHPLFLMYIEGVRLKESILLHEINTLNPQINKATEEIAQIYSEMKKYEIIKETRENEIATELRRKDQLEIDEMAIMNFVRKNEEGYFSS